MIVKNSQALNTPCMSWRFIRRELYSLKFIKVKEYPDAYWIFLALIRDVYTILVY